MSAISGKRYHLVTLGCFRNEVESDLLRSRLASLGLGEVEAPGEADVIIVNTCGFIEDACSEGIDTILELDGLSETSEKVPILVAGCMGQRFGEDLFHELPEVSGVLGVAWDLDLPRALEAVMNGERFQMSRPPSPLSIKRSVNSSDNATLFVRVADGCDRKCSFCTIPKIRGEYTSRPVEEVHAEIERLAAGAEREVVLLAQDLTSYGSDLEGRPSPVDLLRSISRIESVRWIRLLYLQPEGITTRLIDEMTENPKVCDYFDIPFQHVSRSVLRRMGRPGSAEEFLSLISMIREISPHAALRTTMMVGYPGESDRDFEMLLDFLDRVRFDWLAGFVFSAEEGTEAALLQRRIPADVKLARYDRMLELQEAVEAERVQRLVGRELECVIDDVSDLTGYDLRGRSYREAPVVDGSIYISKAGRDTGKVGPGAFVNARITGQEGLDLAGEI